MYGFVKRRSSGNSIATFFSLFPGVLLSCIPGVSLGAPNERLSSTQSPKLLGRDAEIALALSACPASVAEGAAVYVLEKSGYVKVRESRNGFTALVTRLLPNAQGPQCMDAEGARTLLPRYLKIAELQAAGRTADEIRRAVADGFAKGTFRVPTRPGISYMLSTQNLVPNSNGDVVPFPPHLMFYAPYLTNADLGLDGSLGPDGNPAGPVFVAGEGTPHALIIVPVGVHMGGAHAGPVDPSAP